MNLTKRVFTAAACAGVVGVMCAQTAVAQQTWQATLGAQSKDMGKQAIAFLPNEMWIHAGDSIQWTSQSGDIHTVSFLLAGQAVTDFTQGCPGYSPSGMSFTGVNCVSAPPLVQGQKFAVKFPVVGNFKLICLVHSHMTGVIHVLPSAATLPHDQAFYDAQGAAQEQKLLTDNDPANAAMDAMLSTAVISGKNSVAAGIGEMNATAGGFQGRSVVRFLKGTVHIHAGDTVEWTVLDPAMPHTVTFGTEPNNPGPPSGNVMFDADGARHVTLHYVGEDAHSGVFGAVPQNQLGVPQSPPAIPVFRVTFLHPGTYDYKCALHDNLGMIGKVVVQP